MRLGPGLALTAPRRAAAWTPAAVPAARVWLEFSAANTTRTGDEITAAADLTGLGNGWVRETTGPELADLGGGLYAAQGDGAAARLMPSGANPFAGATSAYLAARVKAAGTDPGAGLWVWNSADDPKTFFNFSGGDVYEAFGTTARRNNIATGATLTDWHTWEVAATAAAWTAYLDGTQVGTFGTNTIPDWAIAGGLTTGGTPRVFWNGQGYFTGLVAGLVGAAAVPDAGTRALVRDYLGGLTP
jgi:hypothetical protein